MFFFQHLHQHVDTTCNPIKFISALSFPFSTLIAFHTPCTTCSICHPTPVDFRLDFNVPGVSDYLLWIYRRSCGSPHTLNVTLGHLAASSRHCREATNSIACAQPSECPSPIAAVFGRTCAGHWEGWLEHGEMGCGGWSTAVFSTSWLIKSWSV